MQYIGGKFKVAKELAGIISLFSPKVYWEPFVGAGNVIQYVQSPVKIGSDIDLHIVSYLECVRDGWLPPVDISEPEWRFWKGYTPVTRECYATRAAVGYGSSFGGRFFEGYARDSRRAYPTSRATYNQSVKQAPMLQGIQFRALSYFQEIPVGVDVVYCDPPYAGTKPVGTREPFNSEVFWLWCQALVAFGVTVLVTEFTAPPFAREIWSREKYTDLRRTDGKEVMTERLFMVTI